MSIRRNTLYNLLGQTAPLIIALITVPLYLQVIGEARYGVLAIVWLFTGFFGVFDLGLARATAFHLSRQHRESDQVRATTFWTALWLNLGFGLIGAIVLFVVAHPIFEHFFQMPDDLRDNVLSSLPWIAAALPLSTLSGVFTGALEARERFGHMNFLGVINTSLTQIVPLVVALTITPALSWLIPAVVLARLVGMVFLAWSVWRFLPIVMTKLFDRSQARALFGYGGWISVSNVIAPILVTIDRMLIGSLLSAREVAFYTVPYNLVTRLSIIPGALSTTLFPRFSKENGTESRRLSMQAVLILMAVMTPLTVIALVSMPLFLTYWISPEFSAHAAIPGMILLAGVWVNGLAFIPYAMLQGQNRPDITAKLHLLEMPFFLMMLWFGIKWYGLEGAAFAWSMRVAMDALLLFYFARLPIALKQVLSAGSLLILAALVAPQLLSAQAVLALALVLISIAWAFWSAPELRQIARALVSKIMSIFLGNLGK